MKTTYIIQLNNAMHASCRSLSVSVSISYSVVWLLRDAISRYFLPNSMGRDPLILPDKYGGTWSPI